MDIDKQLGAITAEFWSQIGTNNTTNLIVNLNQNENPDTNEAQAPLSLLDNNEQDDCLNDQSKLMEVEVDYSQQELTPLYPSDVKENDQKQANQQQTLGDIIDETLQKSSKCNPPPKVGRSRKISNRSQQNQSQSMYGSIGTLSNSNNSKKNSANGDNNSVGDWLESQDKQQTLDREEKAIQRKRANNKNKKWTPQELQRLYDLLECFGTDFTTIQQYFDKKTVTQIKNKFHKEEKDNPQKIKELLLCKQSSKRLSIKLENERDFQNFQQYYIDKYLHSNLNAIGNDNSSNSSTPLQLPSPQSSSENAQFNQQSLISRIPQCINLPSESLKIVAEDIERRLLKERSNTH